MCAPQAQAKVFFAVKRRREHLKYEILQGGYRMELLRVDTAACIRCGLCLRACARDIMVLDEQGYPCLPGEKEKRCTRCGHCASACSEGAIRLLVAAGEDIIPMKQELKVSFEQAAQLLRSCRSVRRFKDMPVPQQDIEEILQVARMAPTGGNNQLVRWIVLKDRKTVSRVADMVAEWFDAVARHNPKHAARYAIDNILGRYRSGQDIILRGAPNAVLTYTTDKAAWGPIDSAIGLTYFNLAAHSRGIGSCWGGYLMRASVEYEPLRKFLGIEPETSVQGAMVFGYSDIAYHAIPVRNPLQVRWLGSAE